MSRARSGEDHSTACPPERTHAAHSRVKRFPNERTTGLWINSVGREELGQRRRLSRLADAAEVEAVLDGREERARIVVRLRDEATALRVRREHPDADRIVRVLDAARGVVLVPQDAEQAAVLVR